MNYGYFRCATCSPELVVGDVDFNVDKIAEIVSEAQKNGVQFLVFPELSLTGYTCQDLFLQSTLRKAVLLGLETLMEKTSGLEVLFAVGAPLDVNGVLYNCGVFIQNGRIIAVIPKTFLPNYGEFYEARWFSPAKNEVQFINLSAAMQDIPFGNVFIEDEENPLVKIGCELCEDLWVPLSPSLNQALNGATVIANLSGGNEVVGKAQYRRMLIKAHSAKNICAYIYSNAGNCESTQDMVFSGHSLIAENGSLRAESELFTDTGKLIIADIDLEKINVERLRTKTFAQCQEKAPKSNYTSVFVNLMPHVLESNETESLYVNVDPFPFVPQDKESQRQRCKEVIAMQSQGLAKRLKHIHAQSAVIGLSGGLDSTLALLVTVNAFDLCGIDRNKILCITMPAFGTTDRTYKNACTLAEKCGASLREINIKDSVIQHFKDIGHDENVHDITYENSQARERTQILMDVANQTGGIVIGTGDLSELALGWCTYNGDHMSMYAVNTSIPKTLVRFLVKEFALEAEETNAAELSDVLLDILDTPVSPELLPPENGNISQKTEDIVGPYELHDFVLYYVLRFGFGPKKIFFLEKKAFPDYDSKVILKWLKIFFRRFFTQQFKRSCMPDGAKIGTVNFSPRGDWRMPSDASCNMWLKEIQELEDDLC